MSLNKEEFYKRFLKPKQSSPSKAPTPSIKSERRFEDEKDKEEDVIAPLPEEPSTEGVSDDVAEEEKEYSPETIALGRQLHRQWLQGSWGK